MKDKDKHQPPAYSTHPDLSKMMCGNSTQHVKEKCNNWMSNRQKSKHQRNWDNQKT